MNRSTRDDSTDRLLTREESQNTPDLAAKSSLCGTVGNLFSQQYELLIGERMVAVKAAAQDAYQERRRTQE